MGSTAENLHDRFPQITKENADRFAVQSQTPRRRRGRTGVMRSTVVPMSVFTDDGWTLADRDQFPRPETSLDRLGRAPNALSAPEDG